MLSVTITPTVGINAVGKRTVSPNRFRNEFSGSPSLQLDCRHNSLLWTKVKLTSPSSMHPMSPLLLLPLLLIVAVEAGGGHHHPSPVPATRPLPEQYHAVVITNETARGGRLQRIDIYYDWPRGRALNVIRDQLDAGSSPLRDVQWTNGTSFVFDAASCAVFQFPVGLLPPDWTGRAGAAYLGRERVDGFDCHVWSNFVYARYYEDAATGRPVSWSVVNGTGMQRHVLSFEVGGVPQEATKWQAPPYCFNGTGSSAVAAAASP